MSLQEQVDELTGRRFAPARRMDGPAPGSMRGQEPDRHPDGVAPGGPYRRALPRKADRSESRKLAAESYYFPNTYSQIGRGNTSDAEYVVNASLYPAIDQPSSVAYASKQVPALPRLLKGAGYTTITMHTNSAEFWNRLHFYPALGFEQIYDSSYFGDQSQTGLGAADSVLYERGLPLLLAAQAEEAPFYAHLITVSAHYPFVAGARR